MKYLDFKILFVLIRKLILTFNTPILFIIFNRPDTTQKVFDEIRKIKPKYLFIAADGARNESEQSLCHETRNIVNQIDWDCELKTLFQEKNLGCKIGVSTAINWFFDNVEQGIILEDDCLPSSSFFYFCKDILEKYYSNSDIMHICGTSFARGKNNKDTYYFSKYAHVWGWATWRRSWRLYDLKIDDFDNFFNNNKLLKIYNDSLINDYFKKIFYLTRSNKIDTWDYQWLFTIWNHNGIVITPHMNLISNIGFGENATHTKNKDNFLSNMKSNIISEIKHPKDIKLSLQRDKNIFYKTIYKKNILLEKIKKVIPYRIKFLLKNTFLYKRN